MKEAREKGSRRVGERERERKCAKVYMSEKKGLFIYTRPIIARTLVVKVEITCEENTKVETVHWNIE